jgi:anion-transporting  ArsA/GET3 family ATPase
VNGEAFARAALLAPRIAVCVGCGGVGKTTVAAALGIEAARRGRRAIVLTIDPARRLADALGVETLGNRPQPIPRETLARLGVSGAGSLAAMMLDMKRTFDDLVERFAESEQARERIQHNPIYQHVTDALAGSVEYSAMEKVFELVESGDFDLVVVDTPPAQHALDFLEAPQRLIEFLDSRVVQMLIHPAFAAGRMGFRIFQAGARRALQVMERVSGIGFLEDISEFLLAFEGMSAGFRERAARVRGAMLGPEAAFVLVAGPGRESVRQATRFRQRLERFGVRLEGILVNRVRRWPEPGGPPAFAGVEADLPRLARALAGAGGPAAADAAAAAALDAARGYAALVERDARSTQGLRETIVSQGRFYCEIPELPEDVHDLPGLARIADAIFGEAQGGAAPAQRAHGERSAGPRKNGMA